MRFRPPGMRARSVKVCSGCRCVAYCLETCQKEDWNRVHKGECQTLGLSSLGQLGWLPIEALSIVSLLLMHLQQRLQKAHGLLPLCLPKRTPHNNGS